MSQEEQSNKLANIGETSEKLERLESRYRFTLFLVWIALFLTVIGIAAGYKNWMQINAKANAAREGLQSLQQESTQFAQKSTVVALNSTLLNDFEQRRQELADSVKFMEKVDRNASHALQVMEKQAELLTDQQEQGALAVPSDTNWRLGELRFLLQAANERLLYERDKIGALGILKDAENVLLKLGSKQYLPVRKKLVEEIVELESFLVPNISAISDHIADLIEVIEAMPVGDEIKKSEKVTLLSDSEDDQDDLMSRFVDEINNAVVVRKFDQSVHQSMGMDEKEKLQNLLRLRLETLRLMVLQGLNKDYHRQLDLIKRTLKKYYPDMINASLQKHLDELEKVQLSPTPPDISGSLDLLEKLSGGKNSSRKK